MDAVCGSRFPDIERNGTMGKGKVYTTRQGRIRVVRVGGETFKFDAKGNPLSRKVSK